MGTAALQDRLAAGMYHCNYFYEDLLLIQVCSDPTRVHCNTVHGKMQCPQLSAVITPMGVCPSYRCAMMQHPGHAALVKAE